LKTLKGTTATEIIRGEDRILHKNIAEEKGNRDESLKEKRKNDKQLHE
jgi:hypothetical protein